MYDILTAIVGAVSGILIALIFTAMVLTVFASAFLFLTSVL
jgi:hypothetical protein